MANAIILMQIYTMRNLSHKYLGNNDGDINSDENTIEE